MGRAIGSKNVFSCSNNRAIYTPSGFVTANTAARNTTIWNQPCSVTTRISPASAARTRDTQAGTRRSTTPQCLSQSSLPQLLAAVNIKSHQRKSDNRKNQKDNVSHAECPQRREFNTARYSSMDMTE